MPTSWTTMETKEKPVHPTRTVVLLGKDGGVAKAWTKSLNVLKRAVERATPEPSTCTWCPVQSMSYMTNNSSGTVTSSTTHPSKFMLVTFLIVVALLFGLICVTAIETVTRPRGLP